VMTQCVVHKDMAAGLEVPGCLAEHGDLACCIMCAIWLRHFAQHRLDLRREHGTAEQIQQP